MKRISVIIILIVNLLLFFACAGLKMERGVQDNTFYSSYNPKISIKINPDFNYTGSDSEGGWGPNALEGGESLAHAETEEHTFLKIDNTKFVQISVAKITTPAWFFMPDLFGHIENKIDLGTEKINGKMYQYCVFPIESSSNNCLLAKSLGRIVSAEANCKLTILYIEDIGAEYSCSSWNNVDSLTDNQKRRLEKFLDDTEKDIEILDYQAPVSNISESEVISDPDQKVVCELPIGRYSRHHIIEMEADKCIHNKGKILWHVESLPPDIPHDKYIECLIPGETSPVVMKAGACLTSQGRIVSVRPETASFGPGRCSRFSENLGIARYASVCRKRSGLALNQNLPFPDRH